MNIADCINEKCPYSGKPVVESSLTTFEGHVVGFCNPGCRDSFDAKQGDFLEAESYFRAVIAERGQA